MNSRNLQDMLAGGILLCLGLFFAAYAMMNYPLGTIRNMQAGMFPTVIGCLLAAFGLVILLGGLLRGAPLPRVEWRPLASVAASVAAFAMTLNGLGLICAVALCSLIASAANAGARVTEALILAACLAAMSAGIFHFGLGLQIPLLPW